VNATNPAITSPVPIAVAVAPNGGRRTKLDHPAIPLTVTELAVDAAACHEAGAAMIHAHVRDSQGGHLLDADTYQRAIVAIRQAVGHRLVIQITSESVGRYQPAAQMAVVRAVRPEAVSLALRELVPGPEHERDFAAFLLWLRAEHIIPQIILYAPADALRLADLQRRGLVPWASIPVLYVLGSYGAGRDSQPDDLLPFLDPPMPGFTHWMVCAFGAGEAGCLNAASLRGGHVRTGFENNLHLPAGTLASGNAALVRTVAAALQERGCPLQSADDLRGAWAAL